MRWLLAVRGGVVMSASISVSRFLSLCRGGSGPTICSATLSISFLASPVTSAHTYACSVVRCMYVVNEQSINRLPSIVAPIVDGSSQSAARLALTVGFERRCVPEAIIDNSAGERQLIQPGSCVWGRSGVFLLMICRWWIPTTTWV